MDKNFENWLNTLQPWLVEFLNTNSNDFDSEESIRKGTDLCVKQQENGGKQINRHALNTGNITNIIKIKRVYGTSNLLGLQDNIEITFKDNLNFIYGANGSGKTSLSKLLTYAYEKNINLKENVFFKKTDIKRYKIDYSVNEDQLTYQFPTGSDSVEMEIFDEKSTDRFIASGSQLSIDSPELVLLQKLAILCDHVKQKIDSQIVSELNKKIEILPPEKYKDREELRLLSEIGEVEAHKLLKNFEWTSFQQNELDKIVTELDEENRNKKIKEKTILLENVKKIHHHVLNVVEKYNENSLTEFKTLKQKCFDASKHAEEYARQVFEKSELDKIGSDTWKAMWQAAKKYSSLVYPASDFPVTHEGARCVLCHQPLGIDAKERFKKFDEYVKNSLESEAEILKKQLITSEILDNTANIEVIQEILENIPDSVISKSIFDGVLIEIQNIQKWTELQKKVTSAYEEILLPKTKQVENLLSKTIDDTEKEIKAISQAEYFVNKRVTRENLEFSKWVNDRKSDFLYNAKINDKIMVLEASKSLTTTNKLTSKAKEISEALFNLHYVSRFNEILEELNANALHVKLVNARASKGKGSFRIVLTNSDNEEIETKEVLSTGEQRIVSLAAFIVDSEKQNKIVPLVFDDPVSSLDYEYEEKFAKALVLLSSKRQVIVFSHRLSFAYHFADYIEKEKESNQFIEIKKDIFRKYSGLIDTNSSTFLRKPEKFSGFIKEFGRILEKFSQDCKKGKYNQQELEMLMQGYISAFRNQIESAVELVLVKGVIKRFERNIFSRRIMDLSCISNDSCKIVDELMSKYSYPDHSQPDDTPLVNISIEELQNDVRKLQTICDKDRNRNQ